jgi:hypothetical protein
VQQRAYFFETRLAAAPRETGLIRTTAHPPPIARSDRHATHPLPSSLRTIHHLPPPPLLPRRPAPPCTALHRHFHSHACVWWAHRCGVRDVSTRHMCSARVLWHVAWCVPRYVTIDHCGKLNINRDEPPPPRTAVPRPSASLPQPASPRSSSSRPASARSTPASPLTATPLTASPRSPAPSLSPRAPRSTSLASGPQSARPSRPHSATTGLGLHPEAKAAVIAAAKDAIARGVRPWTAVIPTSPVLKAASSGAHAGWSIGLVSKPGLAPSLARTAAEQTHAETPPPTATRYR